MNENPLLQEIERISDFNKLKEYFKTNQNKSWNKSIHTYSSNSTKECIKTILTLNLKEEKRRKRKHSETLNEESNEEEKNKST